MGDSIDELLADIAADKAAGMGTMSRSERVKARAKRAEEDKARKEAEARAAQSATQDDDDASDLEKGLDPSRRGGQARGLLN